MREEAAWIADLFARFGPVEVKRLFGGRGIFADGAMIGLVFAETIYLRTDDTMRSAWLAEGCKPFQFDKPSQSRTIVTSYIALPDRLYDDGDELALWAQRALAAVHTKKAAQKKPARPQKPRKRAV